MDISVRDINLHPSDHRISSLEKTDWDVVVIGSGPAGRTLADKTAAEGFSSLVIEDELFGGDCPVCLSVFVLAGILIITVHLVLCLYPK